jgi:hypothetical protein
MKYYKNNGFILVSSLLLLILFSFLSINTIQNQSYSSKVDTLKYCELQALIHLKYIKKQLQNHILINQIDINDSRYNINIIKFDQNNSIKYDIYVSCKAEDISIYDNLSLY